MMREAISKKPTDAERELLLNLDPIVRDMLASVDDGPGFLLWTQVNEPAVTSAMSFRYMEETIVKYAEDQGTPWAWLPASEASIMHVIAYDLGKEDIALVAQAKEAREEWFESPWFAYHGGQPHRSGDSARAVLLDLLSKAAGAYIKRKDNA